MCDTIDSESWKCVQCGQMTTQNQIFLASIMVPWQKTQQQQKNKQANPKNQNNNNSNNKEWKDG